MVLLYPVCFLVWKVVLLGRSAIILWSMNPPPDKIRLVQPACMCYYKSITARWRRCHLSLFTPFLFDFLFDPVFVSVLFYWVSIDWASLNESVLRCVRAKSGTQLGFTTIATNMNSACYRLKFLKQLRGFKTFFNATLNPESTFCTFLWLTIFLTLSEPFQPAPSPVH